MINKKDVREKIYKSIEDSLSKLETPIVASKKVSRLLKKASKKIAKQVSAQTKKQDEKLKVAKDSKKIKNSKKSVIVIE